MNRLKPRTAGFALGAFMGLYHAAWAALVAAGVAQPLLDLIFRLHFIAPPFRVATFDPGTAILLVVFMSLVGFGSGYVLAVVWNVAIGRVPRPAAR